MIIKDAKITVALNDAKELEEFTKLLRSTKYSISARELITNSNSVFAQEGYLYTIEGSFAAIQEVTMLLTPAVKQEEKYWLFVRDIKSKDRVAVCSSQEEFSKMLHSRYYDQYEYKLEIITNIDLMTISDEFSLSNQFTKELDDIFNSEDGWKPIQKIIYWSD